MFEDDPDMHDMQEMIIFVRGMEFIGDEASVQKFDPNMDFDADGTAATTSDLGLDNTAAEPVIEMAHDEYPEWFLIEMGTVAIDAAQLASEHQSANRRGQRMKTTMKNEADCTFALYLNGQLCQKSTNIMLDTTEVMWKDYGVTWVSGTFKILLCIWCYFLSSYNIIFVKSLSSYANVSNSLENNNNWLMNEGSYYSDDNYIIRTALYSPEYIHRNYNKYGVETSTDYYPPFGFGLFAHETAPDSYILVIYIGKANFSPVVVWCANQGHPVQGLATLALTSEEGLVLRDADGSFVWSTNTPGLSVRSIQLGSDGNLYYSFRDIEEDRWNDIYLISSSSPLYSDEYNYKNSYMRLDQDGHLRTYVWKEGEIYTSDVFDNDNCSYPTNCGKYGICKDGGFCSCPMGGIAGSWDYFKPVNSFDSRSGCSLVTPLSCPDKHNLHTFLEFVNVTYFFLTPSLTEIDVESCKRVCLIIVRVKPSSFVTIWIPLLAVAFIKVQNKASKKASLKKKSVLLVSSGLIVLFVVIVYMIWRRKSNNAKDFDCSLDVFVDNISRFSFEDLKLATQNFQTKLGRGGFGSVFEGTLGNGTKVAVKQLESVGQGRKEFLAEVNTIGSIHHFNLVRLIGFCDDGLNRLLVYEYMCNGSLEKWIFNQDTSQTLGWNLRRKIINGVAVGLEYLHEHCKQNVIHFDIKPQNILLDKDFNIKISDFGLAKMVDRDQSHVMTMVRGTPGYMAPELVTGSAISVKVDVYSFGVLVLEIVCGRRNFGSSEGDCLTNLVKVKADEDQLSDLIDEHGEAKVLQDLPNMEALTDLTYLNMVHEAAPMEANYGLSVCPTDSLLSGPR
uniref:Non-specific serine/threonine protein kinase n=1 Tax=Chenopodium quinoa TaxID=63459 RepID=A0A803KMI2_CHEQI